MTNYSETRLRCYVYTALAVLAMIVLAFRWAA